MVTTSNRTSSSRQRRRAVVQEKQKDKTSRGLDLNIISFQLVLLIFGVSWILAGLFLPLSDQTTSSSLSLSNSLNIAVLGSAVAFFIIYAMRLYIFSRQLKVRRTPSAECWVFPLIAFGILVLTVILTFLFPNMSWFGPALLVWLAYFLAIFHTGFVRFLSSKYLSVNLRILVNEVLGMLFVSLFLGYILIKYSQTLVYMEGSILFIVGVLGFAYAVSFIGIARNDYSL